MGLLQPQALFFYKYNHKKKGSYHIQNNLLTLSPCGFGVKRLNNWLSWWITAKMNDRISNASSAHRGGVHTCTYSCPVVITALRTGSNTRPEQPPY